MEALNDYVFILPDEPETMTKGGIALPDVAKEKPKSGVCVLGQYKGLRVWYPSYVPFEMKLEDKIHHVCKASELIAKENG